MELDIFIPSLSLAFEFQGSQHFENKPLYLFSDSVDLQQRGIQILMLFLVLLYVIGHCNSLADKEKKLACKKLGITLIEIPHWWDYSRTNLVATIQQNRPELRALLTKDKNKEVLL